MGRKQKRPIRFWGLSVGHGLGLGLTVGVVFPLIGCKSDNRRASAPPPLQVSMPSERATARAKAEPLHLPQPAGPLSVEELERLYQPLPPPPTKNPQTTERLQANKVSVPFSVGAGWDVPISNDWRHIVIHHSATATGSAASIDRSHRDRGWQGLGYHFVIGNGSGSGDGDVEVGYRWSNQGVGAHAGNDEFNRHGIGICLIGNLEETQPSRAQAISLRNLTAFLMKRCGISASHIIGHRDVPGKKTECPGRHFDMAGFIQGLGGVEYPRTAVSEGSPMPTGRGSGRVIVTNAMAVP